MKIVIRPAHLEHDRRVIIEMVARYLNSQADEHRYEWMYLKNPEGPAKAWLAEEESDKRIVGLASAFPRRMVYRGQDMLGWVLGDFCVADDWRALGPAVQLQRAIVRSVDSGMADLFYDFPSHAMMAVYRRLGIEATSEIVRFTKLLRVDGWAEKAGPVSCLASPISKMGNVALTLLDTLRTVDASISVDEVVGQTVGEEFANLSSEAQERFGPCIRRSTRYLSWRYLQNPVRPTTMLAARRNGELLGFSVTALEGGSVSLMDCTVGRDPNAVRAILRAVCGRFRRQGVERLNAPTSRGTWWANQLTDLGFVPRESSPFVAYMSSTTRRRIGQFSSDTWVVMAGDRDC
jgi:hypothetical protein